RHQGHEPQRAPGHVEGAAEEVAPGGGFQAVQVSDTASGYASSRSSNCQNLARACRVDTRMYSCSVWAPSPSAPSPSRVGTPMAEVKLASLPPPVMGASSSVKPASRA